MAQRVSLHGVEVSIPSLLYKIHERTKVPIIFVSEDFDGAPKVSVDQDNVTVETAMDVIFAGLEYGYKKEGKGYDVFRTKANRTSLYSPLTGKVTNAENEPLPGVSVIINGTNRGDTTDGNGWFSIPSTGYKAMLKFSCTGYSPGKDSVDNRVPCKIVLQHFSNLIDEVVVIAYSTTNFRSNTSSSFQLKSSTISHQPAGYVLETMEGRIPGLFIQQSNGYPGSNRQISVRGPSSFINGRLPLQVVDGIIYSGESISIIGSGSAQGPLGFNMLNCINPGNIASIDVLKDAAATAIYGSRGANGAILFTMKKGVVGQPQLTAGSYAGITNITLPKTKYMNTQQFLTMRRDAVTLDKLPGDPRDWIGEYAWDTAVSRDFRRIILGGTGIVNDHTIGVTGGDSTNLWLVNGNYHRESSPIPGNPFDKRLSAYGNYGFQSTSKRFRLRVSGNYSREDNHLPVYDLSNFVMMAPHSPYPAVSGGAYSWWEHGAPFVNLTAVQLDHYKAAISNWYIHGEVGYVIDGLTLQGSVGYNSGVAQEQSWLPFAGQDLASDPTGQYNWSVNRYNSRITEGTATWSVHLKKDVLTVLAGATRQEERKALMKITVDTSASATTSRVLLDEVLYRYEAVFGRAEYNRAGRYILTLSGRRDGSSRFGNGMRYANFGAAGAAWIFTDEKSFHLPKWLSFGKLRGSYGITGNDQIGDYIFAALYKRTSPGLTYQGLAGYTPTSFYNPSIGWEVNYKGEISLDLGLFSNKVSLSATAYRNRTASQLVATTIPVQAGIPWEPANAPITILNRGLEFSLKSVNISTTGLLWTTALALTLPENKLLRFPDLAHSPYADLYREGKSLSEQIGFGYIKVDPISGLYTFLDRDSNKVWDKRDYIAGGSLDPRWYGGLENIITYKDWEFCLFLEYRNQKGIDPMVAMIGQTPPGISANHNLNNFPATLHYWRKEGDVVPYQRVSTDPSGEVAQHAMDFGASSARVRGASFLRIKTLSISRRISQKLLTKLHAKEGNVFTRAQNLLTITKYPLTDPETQSFNSLPPVRTIVLGVQLTF